MSKKVRFCGLLALACSAAWAQSSKLSPDLAALIREVIDTVSLKEQEVQDLDGRWYSMRLRPYRTADNKIDGALVIFIDIHALKTTQTAVQELNNFSTAVMESAATLVMATDGQGRIIRFNRACQQVSGYALEEVQGKFVWDLRLIPADEVESVKGIYRRARGGGSPMEHENHWVTRSGRQRLIAWSTVAVPYARADTNAPAKPHARPTRYSSMPDRYVPTRRAGARCLIRRYWGGAGVGHQPPGSSP